MRSLRNRSALCFSLGDEMKTIPFAVAIAAISAVAAPTESEARDGLYAGLGYSNVSAGDFENMGALTARVGYRIGQYIAIEGETQLGAVDGEYQDLDASIDYSNGVFAVGLFPISEKTDLFVRAGYVDEKVSASGSCGVGCTTTATMWEDGAAYGLGVQHWVGERVGVRAEYTHGEGDFNDTDTLGVSAAFRF